MCRYCTHDGAQRRKLPCPFPTELLQPGSITPGYCAGDSDLRIAARGEFHPPPHWLFHPASLQAMVLTPEGTVPHCTAAAARAFWLQGYRSGWRQLSHRKASCTPRIGSGCLSRQRGKGEREEGPEARAEAGCSALLPYGQCDRAATCHCTQAPPSQHGVKPYPQHTALSILSMGCSARNTGWRHPCQWVR